MDSQIDQPHGRTYGDDPQKVGLHSVLEGEEDNQQQHHEKKSVLKKVKAKAKKIKDTISKRQGHGQDQHEDEHGPDYDDSDEVDDDDMAEEPEVHGAPMYESAATRNAVPRGVGNQGQVRGDLGRSMALEEDPHAPKGSPEAYSPTNYQTKVTDPSAAGCEEAGITPILKSFGKMSVHDEPESKSHQNPPTKTDSDTTTKESPQSQSSSYTEKLSFATSAIADKAISAKNVVASKLGYGGKDDNVVTESRESRETETAKSPSQVGGYDSKIASTVTEKLAPVYGKVAGVGTTVRSKVTGTGTGGETEDAGGKGTDKGVSVKQYWAEKLKPGEEDKALSEAITDTLHKRKEEGTEHKEEKPMGKVTESEEVAKQLGTGEEHSGAERMDTEDVKVNAAGDASGANKGMVNMVKGAVSSWFGKGEVGHGNEGSEERRLQESGN